MPLPTTSTAFIPTGLPLILPHHHPRHAHLHPRRNRSIPNSTNSRLTLKCSGKGFGRKSDPNNTTSSVPKGNENTSGSNSDSGAEIGSLPPGSANSRGDTRTNLGFVGNDHIGISFVCTADDCNTRIAKSVRRLSYEKGTVVIQCPKCEKHHVVADNFGMYSDLTDGKVNIEQIAKAKGESVTRIDDSSLKLDEFVASYSKSENSSTSTIDSDVPPTTVPSDEDG